jgi:hypothetical protein
MYFVAALDRNLTGGASNYNVRISNRIIVLTCSFIHSLKYLSQIFQIVCRLKLAVKKLFLSSHQRKTPNFFKIAFIVYT